MNLLTIITIALFTSYYHKQTVANQRGWVREVHLTVIFTSIFFYGPNDAEDAGILIQMDSRRVSQVAVKQQRIIEIPIYPLHLHIRVAFEFRFESSNGAFEGKVVSSSSVRAILFQEPRISTRL